METLTHDWRIEEREYDRQEQRRGRRHAYERLDPRRTALVVVDLVPFFVEEMPYARGVVPRVNTIATALRGAGTASECRRRSSAVSRTPASTRVVKPDST